MVKIPMPLGMVGWDIGGAHLKAVHLNEHGAVLGVHQTACPLWQGIDLLELALETLSALTTDTRLYHAVTMTGELADNFRDRAEGVRALTETLARRFGPQRVFVFRGHSGFVNAALVTTADTGLIASANWLASGLWAAARYREALFVDIGSTTTDILPICDNQVQNRGYTDSERMRYDELLYTGIARTPAMVLARRVPLAGEWASLMAEHFATSADVYRLTGELPEYADQMPSADHGPKTVAASSTRLARLFGRDGGELTPESWHQAARYLREQQLCSIWEALELQLSRGLLSQQAPVIGAGIGAFLVEELSARMRRPYVDFGHLFVMSSAPQDFRVADCGPAAAVACLAWQALAG
jgi:probable H4MPT-linked C1 transfer pathway protein